MEERSLALSFNLFCLDGNGLDSKPALEATYGRREIDLSELIRRTSRTAVAKTKKDTVDTCLLFVSRHRRTAAIPFVTAKLKVCVYLSVTLPPPPPPRLTSFRPYAAAAANVVSRSLLCSGNEKGSGWKAGFLIFFVCIDNPTCSQHIGSSGIKKLDSRSPWLLQKRIRPSVKLQSIQR